MSSTAKLLERIATLESEQRALLAELDAVKAQAVVTMRELSLAPPPRETPLSTVWAIVVAVCVVAWLASGSIAFWLAGVTDVSRRL